MVPSKKWFAARVTAVTTLATMWATTGSWDQEETLAAIGIASAALIAWLLPNAGEEGEKGLTLLEVLVVLLIVLVILFLVGAVR